MNRALYVAYFSGVAGQSLGFFYIGDGVVAGINSGTTQYDGTYTEQEDGSLAAAVQYVVPAGTNLITGAASGTSPMRIPLNLSFPRGFDDGRYITIDTPLGAVNARFEKMRDLP